MCRFDEFAKAVGLLMEDDVDRLRALGFSPDDNGSFETDKLPDLVAFCEKHPDYHIVTLCDEGYCNDVRWVNRQLYYLADGSKDPELHVDACRVCGHFDCSCEDFEKAVGLLGEGSSERLKALGFSDTDFDCSSSFDTGTLPQLLAFCERHPQYHVVTQCDLSYCNRVCNVDPIAYYLADGNKDPELCGEGCEDHACGE